MNRVKSKRFPNTVCKVVKQPRQFSWYPRKGMTNKRAKLAREVIQNKHPDQVNGALFFTATTHWLKRRVIKVIGRHRFYG